LEAQRFAGKLYNVGVCVVKHALIGARDDRIERALIAVLLTEH